MTLKIYITTPTRTRTTFVVTGDPFLGPTMFWGKSEIQYLLAG